MFEKIMAFAYWHPVALFALLAIGIILVWYRGYVWGNSDGHKEQHQYEVDKLCRNGDFTYELVDSHGDHWKVMVTAIMQRRGKRSV